MLTVEDIWRIVLPDGTELAGGANGLLRQVSWVARMLPRPPGFSTVKGGELALISLQSLKLLDERLALADLVSRLAEKQVAGIAVVGSVSASDSAVADQQNVPLLILPKGTSLLELEQEIIRVLIERRSELYRRDQEIFAELTELAIDGKGMPAILKKLASMTGKLVVLEDEDLVPQHLIGHPEIQSRIAEAKEWLENSRLELQERLVSCGQATASIVRLALPAAGLVRIVTPISAKERVWGYLSLIGNEKTFFETDRIALMRAAAACAIEIARDRAILETQDRLQSDFVEDLLIGDFPTPEVIVARGKRLGYALTPPYAVFALSIRNLASAAGNQERSIEGLSTLEHELHRIDPSYLCLIKDRLLFVLVPVEANSSALQLKKLAEEVRGKLAACAKGAEIAIGIGRTRGALEEIKHAYQEARQALAMGMRLFGPSCVVFFGDLGVYRLLFSLHDTPDLRMFYDEVLGPLVRYDKKSGTELVKTLQAYFAACCSLTDAADRLHLHRNTLLYRLHRIREIAGIDLDDAETRLALQLALRIGETLQATNELQP